MPSKLEVKVVPEVPRSELESVVNQEIVEFDRFFQGLGNDKIVRSEVAIIKTFLAWKLNLGEEAWRSDR